MPSWSQILTEIQTEVNARNPQPLDSVRRRHLKNLYDYRKRNIICYYSGWLQKPNIRGVEIDDNDKNAFMTVIHNLDRKKGLDLFCSGGKIYGWPGIIAL